MPHLSKRAYLTECGPQVNQWDYRVSASRMPNVAHQPASEMTPTNRCRVFGAFAQHECVPRRFRPAAIFAVRPEITHASQDQNQVSDEMSPNIFTSYSLFYHFREDSPVDASVTINAKFSQS